MNKSMRLCSLRTLSFTLASCKISPSLPLDRSFSLRRSDDRTPFIISLSKEWLLSRCPFDILYVLIRSLSHYKI